MAGPVTSAACLPTRRGGCKPRQASFAPRRGIEPWKRSVEEVEQTTRALLEACCELVLKTPYDDFDLH